MDTIFFYLFCKTFFNDFCHVFLCPRSFTLAFFISHFEIRQQKGVNMRSMHGKISSLKKSGLSGLVASSALLLVGRTTISYERGEYEGWKRPKSIGVYLVVLWVKEQTNSLLQREKWKRLGKILDRSHLLITLRTTVRRQLHVKLNITVKLS